MWTMCMCVYTDLFIDYNLDIADIDKNISNIENQEGEI